MMEMVGMLPQITIIQEVEEVEVIHPGLLAAVAMVV